MRFARLFASRGATEIGIDISREFPKPLTAGKVQAADVVITMGCGGACPSTRANATSTGICPAPQASTWKPSARSGMTSTSGSANSSPGSWARATC